MTVDVQPTPTSITPTTFTFVVPGHQNWRIRSIRAVCARDVGGAPLRAYTLTVNNAQTVVVAAGAGDAGPEPGDCSVTWTDSPASSSPFGAPGVIVAPIGPISVPAGYTIVGTVVDPAPADQWLSAVAWFDYTLTTP